MSTKHPHIHRKSTQHLQNIAWHLFLAIVVDRDQCERAMSEKKARMSSMVNSRVIMEPG